jgi:hypothetical protein
VTIGGKYAGLLYWYICSEAYMSVEHIQQDGEHICKACRPYAASRGTQNKRVCVCVRERERERERERKRERERRTQNKHSRTTSINVSKAYAAGRYVSRAYPPKRGPRARTEAILSAYSQTSMRP